MLFNCKGWLLLPAQVLNIFFCMWALCRRHLLHFIPRLLIFSISNIRIVSMFGPYWLLAGEQDPRCGEPRLWSWEWPAANNWQTNGLERCDITGDTESISGDPVDELPHQRSISRSELRGEGGGSEPIRVESYVRTVYISNDGHGYVTNEMYWRPDIF